MNQSSIIIPNTGLQEHAEGHGEHVRFLLIQEVESRDGALPAGQLSAPSVSGVALM